ncbi:MAG: hypothetical protein HY290_12875 [Planctomycetia bacterium]|nr:hypothetical protein [Planctomycetia bacterium]
MDDREYPTIGKIIIEIATPMLIALAVVALFSPVGMPWLLLAVLVVVGLASGPVFIWLLIRSENHRDDPRHAKLPSDDP